MNVILLRDEDFTDAKTVRFTGRRVRHMNDVLKCVPGDALIVGRVGGKLGQGVVQRISQRSAELSVICDRDPPVPLPITLILALPRPIVMNRLLAAVTTLGVKRLFLIHSRRVEKSYWNSPVLRPENIDKQMRLGLEQAVDTILPEVNLRKRFKPFVEDELPGLIKGTTSFFAHPTGGERSSPKVIKKGTLIIGPEGGFIPYEVDHFAALGIASLSLGCRILRVETAVHVAVTKVDGWITATSR